MEKLLKRHFWVVHVVLIAAIAGFMALAAGNLIEGILSPFAITTPPPARKAGVKAPTRVPAVAQADDCKWGCPEPVEPTPEPEPEPEEVADETPQVEGEYPVSDLQLTLTGTMVAGDPSWSMALLIDGGTRASFMTKEGDALVEEGTKVIKIERDRLVLERNGRLEQIELSDGEPKTGRRNPTRSSTLSKKPAAPKPLTRSSSPKPTVTAASSKHAALKQGIKKINEHSFEVDRKTIEQVITNPKKFQDGTRPVPNYKGGKVNGFKLVGMKPGSIYYDLGIRPGDVIVSVNGKSLNSPNVALEMYGKLNSLSNVKIGIERGGQKIDKSFNLK